jgi:hypothetical protein
MTKTTSHRITHWICSSAKLLIDLIQKTTTQRTKEHPSLTLLSLIPFCSLKRAAAVYLDRGHHYPMMHQRKRRKQKSEAVANREAAVAAVVANREAAAKPAAAKGEAAAAK